MKYSVIAMVILTCSVLNAAGQLAPRVVVVDGVVHVTGIVDAGSAAVGPGVQFSMGSDVSEQEWREVFSVYTDEAFGKKLPQAVAGDYSLTSDGLSFTPSYPFSSGSIYHAVFSSAAFSRIAGGLVACISPATVNFEFHIPVADVFVTTVDAVYPESVKLPENLLKMYIVFSGPMMPGEAYKHISLRDSKGERVEKAFLIVDQELWDANRTRFTLLFDPGRIKRGLKANLELGPALKDGEQYTLVIDSTWSDVNGNGLQKRVLRKFLIDAPVRTRLSVDNMKVIAPPAITRAPLVVQFDRAMDRALVFRYVTIRDVLGNMVNGSIGLDHDNVLQFTPDLPWEAGRYTVFIDPLLEDVAGNNFKNAFDVDLAQDGRLTMNDPVAIQVSVVADAK
ncbi:MAG: Ig-like domain-containing protein [Chryseolinea sp.]